MRARADRDRLHVAGQETRAVSATDSPRASCSSSPRRISGVAPSSATRPRKRPGCGSRAARRPARRCSRPSARPLAPPPPALQPRRTTDQLRKLVAAQLLAGRKSAPSRRGYYGGAVHVISWNLFHGRDKAPDPRASHLALAAAEDDRARRALRAGQPQLSGLRRRPPGGVRWDVALLQESPPRWAAALTRRSVPRPTAPSPRATGFGACRGCSPTSTPT